MAATLPAHPHLTHLKHQAKQLLRAHREGRPAACDVLRHLHRFARKDDGYILAAPLALHEAQYALAMEYGFRSWNALRVHVESLRQAEGEPAIRSLVNTESVWATIDAINDEEFHGRPIMPRQRQEAAAFLAELQGKPGSYSGMVAPTEKDLREGIRLFTGERVGPGPGMRHILGEEACRTLLRLDVQSAGVGAALVRASEKILASLAENLDRPARPAGGLQPGMFCCMKCSCALWRHLAARGRDEHEAFLAAGVKALRAFRDGQGRWKYWPFGYVLLALGEIDSAAARVEMRYAAKACEAELKKRTLRTNVYSARRRSICERVLARC